MKRGNLQRNGYCLLYSKSRDSDRAHTNPTWRRSKSSD